MHAAICAISLTSGIRSGGPSGNRAATPGCWPRRSPAPSWSAPRRTAARRRCAPRSASTTSAGSALPPVTRATRSAPWRRPKPAHGQRGHVRLAGPGRLELRPEGDQHQHRQLPDALDHQAQQLERRRVDPVHVLVQRQHRLLRRQARELVDQRLQASAASAPPGVSVERRIALAGRDPEQGGEQRHRPRPAGRSTGASSASSLASCASGGVVAIEPRRPLQQPHDGVQRAVGVIGRAVLAERRVWLGAEALAQRRLIRRVICRSPARPTAAPPGRRRPWPTPSARAGCRARARARPAG